MQCMWCTTLQALMCTVHGRFNLQVQQGCNTLFLLLQDLREEVIAGQGAEALVAIIHSTPGMGLPVQVRVASAAALVALGMHL